MDYIRIADDLRDADRREAELLGDSAEKILREAPAMSDVCLTLERLGEPAAMFGCKRIRQRDGTVYGLVWLMGTNGFATERRFIVRNSRKWLDVLTKGCAASGNVVDLRNTVHIRWLKWLGYTLMGSRDQRFLVFHKTHVQPRRRRRHLWNHVRRAVDPGRPESQEG